jgi:hypothetical protein
VIPFEAEGWPGVPKAGVHEKRSIESAAADEDRIPHFGPVVERELGVKTPASQADLNLHHGPSFGLSFGGFDVAAGDKGQSDLDTAATIGKAELDLPMPDLHLADIEGRRGRACVDPGGKGDPPWHEEDVLHPAQDDFFFGATRPRGEEQECRDQHQGSSQGMERKVHVENNVSVSVIRVGCIIPPNFPLQKGRVKFSPFSKGGLRGIIDYIANAVSVSVSV